MIDIKLAAAKLLKDEYGIDEQITAELFERRILFEPAIRNYLIREEYKKKATSKEKMRVRGNIGDKFCISAKMVEKIIT
jgi:hypothetical protein